MNLGTASRFAVLDDDFQDRKPRNNNSHQAARKAKTEQSSSSSKTAAKKTSQTGKQNKKHNEKSLQNKGPDPDLQSLAFGIGKHKKSNIQAAASLSNSKTNVKSTKIASKDLQDEEEIKYQNELKQALQLSQMEYETNKMLNDTVKIKTELHDKGKSNNKSLISKSSLCLEEFDSVPQNSVNHSKESCTYKLLSGVYPDFIYQHAIENGLQLPNESFLDTATLKRAQQEFVINKEVIKLSKVVCKKDDKIKGLVEKLAKAYESNSLLQEEINKYKGASLSYNDSVKQQMEDLSKENAELTSEVAKLHVEVEQERSKNHNLQSQLLRIQSSKKDGK